VKNGRDGLGAGTDQGISVQRFADSAPVALYVMSYAIKQLLDKALILMIEQCIQVTMPELDLVDDTETGESVEIDELEPIPRKAGRVKGVPNRITVAGSNITPLPPHNNYNSPHPGRSTHPNKAFEYVQGLNPDHKANVMLYVYRRWPVISIPPDPPLPGIKPKTPGKNHARIAKIPAEASPRNIEDLMRWYGSGEYEIYINDSSRNTDKTLKDDRPLAKVWISVTDPDFPPVIENLAWVVPDAPRNQPFIQNLKDKGIWPGSENKEDEEDMANAAANAETIGKLTDTVIEMAKKDRTPLPPAPVQNGDSGGNSRIAEEVVGTMGHMLRETIGVVTKANDPERMVNSVLAAAKTMIPQRDDSQVVIVQSLMEQNKLLMQANIERDREERQSMREEIKILRTVPPPVVTNGTPISPQKSFIEQVREVKEASELLGFSKPEEEEKPVVKAANGFLEKAFEWAPTIFGMWAASKHNAAVQAIAEAMKVNPTAAAQIPQPQAPPNIPVPGPLKATAEAAGLRNGIPVTSPGADSYQPLTEATAPVQEQMPNMIQYVMGQITEPMIQAINAGKTGDIFAKRLVNFHGQIFYDGICRLGKEKLFEICKSWQPLWGIVGAAPDRFELFLDEFLAYGQVETAVEG